MSIEIEEPVPQAPFGRNTWSFDFFLTKIIFLRS